MSKVFKWLDYIALFFWLIVFVPYIFRLKKRNIIQIGDCILLNVLTLIGSEFLWLYILYNHIIVT